MKTAEAVAEDTAGCLNYTVMPGCNRTECVLMEISSKLKRKDGPVSNSVPKSMGKYFQGTSKRAVHIPE